MKFEWKQKEITIVKSNSFNIYIPKVPEPRSWYTFTLNKNTGILIGGYGDEFYKDMYMYKFKYNEWYKISTSYPHPVARHSAVNYLGSIYCFGGYSIEENKRILYDDLWCYSVEEKVWKKIESLNGPSARMGHSAIIHNHKMYIFGGFDEESLDELFEYDFINKEWKEIVTKFRPSKRFFHTSVVYKDKMYIIGGTNHYDKLLTKLSYELVYEFDLVEKIWNLVDYHGEFPFKITDHSSSINDNIIYIFGGMAWNSKITNNLYSYNIETREFKNLSGNQKDLIRTWRSVHYNFCGQCGYYLSFSFVFYNCPDCHTSFCDECEGSLKVIEKCPHKKVRKVNTLLESFLFFTQDELKGPSEQRSFKIKKNLSKDKIQKIFNPQSETENKISMMEERIKKLEHHVQFLLDTIKELQSNLQK